MTFHIAITLLVLMLLLCSLLGMVRSNTPKALPPFGLTIAIALLLLPMSYSFVVPLSHFVFEATSDNILWFKVVFIMLWTVSGITWWKQAAKHRQLLASFAYATIYSILGFWGYLGVTLSQYEFSPTPEVISAPVYVAHWGSVQLVVLCLLFLLLIRTEATRSKWSMGAIMLLIPTYLLVAFYPLLAAVE